VVVIGNRTGLTGTVSDGVISAFREKRSLIQITAPISPGSSGSPVMDEDARVIGVATLNIAEGQNLNFAIAVEKVSTALMQPPSEQLSGTVLPIATPTPAIDARGYFERRRDFLGKNDYDKAISEFTEGLRLDPYKAFAYYRRAVAYKAKSEFNNAISDYNEALRLDPNLAYAYLRRGDAYDRYGNFDRAISDLTEAIRLYSFPASPDNHAS
jgi:tetratricopeptide (TPR) repeat protein